MMHVMIRWLTNRCSRSSTIGGLCAIFAATAGIVWFVGVGATSSLGATRSSKLIWQQQQSEMQAAEQAVGNDARANHVDDQN
jgi:hypothetical protein